MSNPARRRHRTRDHGPRPLTHQDKVLRWRKRQDRFSRMTGGAILDELASFQQNRSRFSLRLTLAPAMRKFLRPQR